eukprot:407821-Alexandrium_andersonii.AAC.1
MAETPLREASPLPRRPFRALSGPPPDGRRHSGRGCLHRVPPREGRPKLPCQGASRHRFNACREAAPGGL